MRNDSKTEASSVRLIALGVITGAHGVHGRVKVKSYTENPQNIASYGALSDKWGEREFSLRITGRLKELLLAEIEGVTKREQADALRGVELCVPRDHLPMPENDGEFLIEDLIGLSVQLDDGTAYGRVKAFHNYGAGDILEIAPVSGGETELVMFTDENFSEITETTITFHPPEILQAKPDQKD